MQVDTDSDNSDGSFDDQDSANSEEDNSSEE